MGRSIGLIERGKIIESEPEGYRVASLDRDGIETLPLRPLEESRSFLDGDIVCYFVFPDGTGRIICGI